jgi:hypothetical protein
LQQTKSRIRPIVFVCLFQSFSSTCAPAYSSSFACRFIVVFPLTCTHTHKQKTRANILHTQDPLSLL